MLIDAEQKKQQHQQDKEEFLNSLGPGVSFDILEWQARSSPRQATVLSDHSACIWYMHC